MAPAGWATEVRAATRAAPRAALARAATELAATLAAALGARPAAAAMRAAQRGARPALAGQVEPAASRTPSRPNLRRTKTDPSFGFATWRFLFRAAWRSTKRPRTTSSGQVTRRR